MKRRGGPCEEVPLTEEAQEMLGPRWEDARPFIPHQPQEYVGVQPLDAEVTYWALTDDSLF